MGVCDAESTIKTDFSSKPAFATIEVLTFIPSTLYQETNS